MMLVVGGFRREARCAWLSEDSLAFDNVIIKMDGIGEVKTIEKSLEAGQVCGSFGTNPFYLS